MKAIMFVLAMALSATATAAIKCERNLDGSTCCWDTAVEGPYKPLSCL
jgi:hypothetical protein